MKGHQHNAGCGDEYCFHGAYTKKADAVAKEEQTPGSFILAANYPPYSIQDRRFAVVTPRQATGHRPQATGKKNPSHIRLHGSSLKRFNMAVEWMQEKAWNYHNAQALAEDASAKYDVRVADLLPAARAIKSPAKSNPFFTRSEKKKIARTIRHGIKGVVRRAFFGRSRSRSGPQPPSAASSGVRSEVIEAMMDQYNVSRKKAAAMVPQASSGESFGDLFKRAMKRNPEGDAESRNAIRGYEEFHGAKVDKIIELENDLVKQKKYFLLGRLYGFDMKAFPRFYADDNSAPSGRRQEPNLDLWRDNIWLCSDAPPTLANGKRGLGTQLFLWGGNQKLDHLLPDFGVESDVQRPILGEIERVWYVTKKAIHNHADEKYVHPFGEACRPTCPVDHKHHETAGEKPVLVYDRRIQHMLIAGGDYTIHPEGIVN